LGSLNRTLTDKEKLVLRLNEQYPKDVGVLAAFFLNLVSLKPGQVRAYSGRLKACLQRHSRALCFANRGGT
jgi:mannose-6-phosphate isomerase class I